MVESAPPVMLHWDCLEWVKAYPHHALRIAIGGLIAGLLIVVGWHALSIWVKPPIPVMEKWVIETTPNGHSWLVMTYQSRAISSCTRVGAYFLSRPGTLDRLPDYIPMGNSLVGAGVNSKPGVFRVWLDVTGVPSGDWTFVYRTLHFCGPLGLIEWPDPGKQIVVTVP